tara:strand:+ start:7871 stop:8920 length:1050 start_codon:yes stop_codon:yes gene_type:complete
MSKPGKILRTLCKRLGVRLTVKRGKNRVYKSVTVLKRQCANKKKKKVKRKRRRKFGSVKKLQMIAAEAVVDDLFKQLDDENSETFRESYSDLYKEMKKGNYPDFTLNMLVRKFLAKLQTIIQREKFEKYYNAWKKFLKGYLFHDRTQLSNEIWNFNSNYQKNNEITWGEIGIYQRRIKKIEKEISDQNSLMEEKRWEEFRKAQEKKLVELKKEEKKLKEEEKKQEKKLTEQRKAQETKLVELKKEEKKQEQERNARRQKEAREELEEKIREERREKRAEDLERYPNPMFDWNVYSPHIGLGVGLAGLGGLGYLTHKFIKDQKKKRKFGKKKKRKVKRKRKKVKRKRKKN